MIDHIRPGDGSFQRRHVGKVALDELDVQAAQEGDIGGGADESPDALATGSVDDTKGNRQVKSVLLTPQSITKDNVKTVVDEGQVKASEICVGDLQATCQQLGINAT